MKSSDYNFETTTQTVDKVLQNHNVADREAILTEVKEGLARSLDEKGISPENWNGLFTGKGEKGQSAGAGGGKGSGGR